MDSSLNHRRPAQSSSISENTAPIILMSDFLMGEELHHAVAALELAVGAFLHVVGAQPDVVPAGEVQVG